MQEDLITAPPVYKLYKDRAIYVGTFLGGPLAGGYMAAQNFARLGQPEKVKASWIFGILATVTIFSAVVLIPGVEKIPRYIIPLFYTLLTQLLIQKYQGNAIKTHMENSGGFYSVWRGVMIGIISGLIVVAVLFAVILVMDRDTLQTLLSGQ